MSYGYPVRGVQMQEGRRALPSSPHLPSLHPRLFITLADLSALLKIQGRSHSRLLVRKTGGLERATYLPGLPRGRARDKGARVSGGIVLGLLVERAAWGRE